MEIGPQNSSTSINVEVKSVETFEMKHSTQKYGYSMKVDLRLYHRIFHFFLLIVYFYYAHNIHPKRHTLYPAAFLYYIFFVKYLLCNVVIYLLYDKDSTFHIIQ